MQSTGGGTFVALRQLPQRYFKVGCFAAIAVVCLCGIEGKARAEEHAKPRALLYGEAESPLLPALSRSMKLLPYNGNISQLKKAQLVILDGDHISPEALRNDPLVQIALRSGRWVLALDVTKSHKRIGLADMLSATTDRANLAYLVHMGRHEDGGPQIDLIEVPNLKDLRRQELGIHAASTIVKALRERMAEDKRRRSTDLTDEEIPPGLLYVTYNFSQIYPEGVLRPYIYHGLYESGDSEPPDLPQSPTLQVNERITVFLNNSNNPQGDYQYIVAESDLAAAPKLPNESFADFQAGSIYSPSGDYTELGWFQTKVNANLTPNSDPAWTLLKSSPETVNGQASVTSGVTFNVGFNQAQGGSGSFGYTSSTTRTIQDWKETNDSAETQANWRYRTANPVDADQADYYCREQTNLYSQISCFPEKLPNDLSINTLQLHTSAVWQTPSVVAVPATIAVQSLHEMVLLWCPEEDLGFFGTCTSPAQVIDDFPHSVNLSINLGAVLPVPIESVTFSPNPAPAGAPVTGTVTLKSQALLDTNVLLTSNSQNATVLPKVKIPRGQTSANFQVLTNANGLSCGNSTTATIDAFYAQDKQAQLQVVAKACS